MEWNDRKCTMQIPRPWHRELEQMEPILNFQVPTESLELVISLHTQNSTKCKPIINSDS